MPGWLQVTLVICGFALIVAAAALHSLPAALIVSGVGVISAGLLSPDAHSRGGGR